MISQVVPNNPLHLKVLGLKVNVANVEKSCVRQEKDKCENNEVYSCYDYHAWPWRCSSRQGIYKSFIGDDCTFVF